MAFNAQEHATREIQRRVGLFVATIDVPRRGDRTIRGDMDYNLICACAHQDSLTVTDATWVLSQIPQAVKDDPPTPDVASTISKLCNMAGITTYAGCAEHLPNGGADPIGLTYYCTTGNAIIFSKIDSTKFVAFVWANMDDGHRVKWYNLTGREQYEWYECWTRCGRTHRRNAQGTLGLRGTDLNRIIDQGTAGTALTNSPSLMERRPANHPVPDAMWNNAARELEF